MTLVVQLMGTVRLKHDGQLVDVGGPKQQSVLAVLALSAGHRVSTDRLVDIVWDESPPATARRTVQSYVSSLRRAMGAGSVLESSQNGYTLNLDRTCVDLLAFEDQATQLLAQEDLDPDNKAQALAAVLSSWETPLDGLRSGSRLGELAAPFEELRLQGVQGLAAAQTAGTRAADAVQMLEGLVREYPTRENLWLELAHGLNRLGRRDAALDAIQRAREALREHLGVNLSALLSAFETDLLIDGTDHGRSNSPAGPAGRPGNLPTPLSSFVGRENEIGVIAQRLRDTRLVTLRGLGGIGKTSLALRVAAAQAAQFDDGVWFIDLAYVAPAAAMSERFLAALGLPARADVDPLDQLLAQLKPRRALLVVDNCEQQIHEIAALVEQIVQCAPDVRVLATSRRSLALAGEAVWQVEPLEESAAAELFSDRARLVRQDFELGAKNRRLVELICEKLDGIPLSIELAAARLKVLNLDQIHTHLDHRFELLSAHAAVRGNDERTLRSALDWSYGLLAEPDRSLLRRLAVFPADFTLDAAHEICAADADFFHLVNSIGLLVEASLVVFDTNDINPRYRLLETVREYVAETQSSSERAQVEFRHMMHYVRMASRIAVQQETDHIGALQACDRDLDNFRAAMACAFENDEPELGLSIARHLRLYFFSRQLNHESLRWLQAGLAMADPSSEEALFAIANALVAAINADDVDVVASLAVQVENSVDLARSPTVRARLLSSSAAHLMDIDPRAADVLLATATKLVKHVDTFETISCIHNRIYVGWRTGDLPHAESMLADLDVLPDGQLVRRERVLIAIQAAACTGRWEEVIDTSLEHYGIDEETSADLLVFRAEALGALSRLDEAIATIDEHDDLSPTADPARTGSHIMRATIELRRGGAARAALLLAESAAAFTRKSERINGFWIASLAGVAAQQLGEADTAALLFGCARALGNEFDVNLRMSERPLIERASQQCRASLGPERFDELASLGASSNWVELVARLAAG